MKARIWIVFLLTVTASGPCISQGWVAKINVDLNHSLYAFETIENAQLTFSGVTMSGNSTRSNVQFIVNGTGSPSGDLHLSIRGTAFEPYDQNDPASQSLYGQLTANYNIPCIPGYFKTEDPATNQQVSVSIIFYPRLQISNYTQDCDKITLTTSTCYRTLFWEVSENISGSYKKIPGETETSMTVTREELIALGLDSPHGRLYFRVTGESGTTSQLQPVDIYHRSPDAVANVTPPKCHNGMDGSVEIQILSPDPAIINDFVITLHEAVPPEKAIRQVSLNDAFNMSFDEIASGSYWIRVENNSSEVYGSCWTDFALAPLVNPEPVTIPSFEVSNYHGYAIKCHGSNEGTLKVNALGGTGSYSAFDWTPRVSTTDFADSLSAGTYHVKVQDSNGCWSGINSRTVYAPEELSVNLISSGGTNGFDVSCYDHTDGRLSAHITGGIPEYAYQWSTGAPGNSLDNLGIGNYAVVITDGNGCAAGQSTKLTAPEPIEFTIREISPVRCSGDNSGVLEVGPVANNIGNVFYSWSSGENQSQITKKPAGIYTLTVSDGQGCSSVKSHTLTEPASYTVQAFATSDFNGSAIRCYGEANGQLAALLKDDAGNVAVAEHYVWFKNGTELISGPGIPEVRELSAGNYRVVATYKTFCSVEALFVLDDPIPISSEILVTSNYNGMPISCSGEEDASIKAIASGGTGVLSFAWDNGKTGSELKNLGAGTYGVTIRDINGCEAKSETILISPLPIKPEISVLTNYNGQPVSCSDASDARIRGSAKGGTAPYMFSWNSGQIVQELAGLPAGYYALTISDANGCLASVDTTLVNPEPVEALVEEISNYHGHGITCNGGADGFIRAGGRGGTRQYTYAWDGSPHTQHTYEGLKAGTYIVTVTDQNGCRDTTKALISEPEALRLSVAATRNISCSGGNDGQIELQATGGTGAYRYSIDQRQWQMPSIFDSLKALTHKITAQDENGCAGVIEQPLDEPLPLVITFADIQPAFCGDPRGSVSAIINGGTGTYQYAWQNSEHETFSDRSTASGLQAGIYNLRVLDGHFCESSRSIGITSTDGPKAVFTNLITPTCSYSLNGSASVEITDGHGPFAFAWQNGQKRNNATNLGGGNHLVEVTDSNNCTIVESVFIPAPDTLKVDLVEKIEPFCHNDCTGKLKVSARGGNGQYQYVWGNSTGAEATQLCAGTYDVRATDIRGCSTSQSFTIHQPDPVTLALVTAKSPDCANECDGFIEMSAQGGTGSMKYTWSTGETLPTIIDLCAGSYTLTAMDENNCVQFETITLESPAEYRLDLGANITLCAGQTHTLDGGAQLQQFLWASNTGFKSASQKITITDAGLYWLQAVTAQGCVVRDTFRLATSRDLLNANFLLATEVMPGDTVVLIDISWPMPDNITWHLPPQMTQLENRGDILYAKSDESGQYNVSLTATLGECRDDVTKTIHVSGENNPIAEGRLGLASIVKKFSLFPNPNDGAFVVDVELKEESEILLTIWNTMTGKKIGQVKDSGKTNYLINFDLKPLSAGQYTLRLECRSGTKYIRFIAR
jgi:hypothetical protein